MKKKLFALVLVIALAASLAIGLAACNPDDKYDGFTIGAVYITSQNDTAGYTYAHHNGIKSAMAQLGLPDAALKIADNVPDTNDTATANAIDALVNQGCDMIIAISFNYLNVVDSKAKEFPNVVFTHGTGNLSNDKNFNNYFGRIYQARYLSGIAAGLKAKELKNPKLGFVSAYGNSYAETASGINAFALGAQSVYPEATVKVRTIGDWANEKKERELAEALLKNDGCGVISQHCDSAQPQLAAEDEGKFGVGYNSDMTVQAPKAHLTAPVWHWDVYYKAAIEAAMQAVEDANGGAITTYSSLIGKDYYAGIKDGLVGVSPLSVNCEKGTKEAIDKVTEMMIAWENDNTAANGFDVFGGYKLNITVNEDGSVTVEKVADALMTEKGDQIVAAGGAYVGDKVIKGEMDWFVEGVYGVYDKK